MKQSYTVKGMTCGGCSSSLARAFTQKHPALTVHASHSESRLTIEGELELSEVKAIVETAGYAFVGLYTL